MTLLLNAFIRSRSLWNRATKGHRLDIELLPKPLPKIIWMFWAQGLDDAPDTVTRCVKSWQRQNPDWDVRIITEATLGDYLDRSKYPESMSLNHLADMLRLQLMKDYGGVWADATSYCVHPVDAWLVPWMQGGFFAFDQPTPGRVMANWLLASEKNGKIATTLHREMNAYWRGRKHASDYFWFHYTFEWLLYADPSFRRAWKAVPKLSSDGPHILFAAARAGTVSDLDGDDPAFRAIPVHKLSWKEPLSDDILNRLGLT